LINKNCKLTKNEDLYTRTHGLSQGYYNWDTVKILYTNVRSLTKGNKREELKILLQDHNVDILGVTETWGRCDILDSEFEFSGFKLYRKDRSLLNDKKGGGVALYIRDSLVSIECDDLNSRQCESVWCKVYANPEDCIIVGVCYHNPGAEDAETNQLFQCIRSAMAMDLPILIMGDFNYPGVNWVQLRGSDTKDNKFLKLVMDCFLEQHVSSPTRDNNILDLVLTNEVQIKDGVSVLAPVENCDHNVLLWEIEVENRRVLGNKAKLCYNQADYVSMRQFVKNKIGNIDSSLLSVSTLWQKFNTVLQEAIKLYVPVSSANQRRRSKPLWMTGKVIRSVKKKHRLWLKWSQHHDDKDLLKYKKQANKASKAVKLAKMEFEKKIAKNIKNDSKSFYTYARSKSRVRPTVGPLMDGTGKMVSNDAEMGEMLNEFFASVFTVEDINCLPAVKQCFSGQDKDKLCTYTITADMVKAKLCKLKMNKAPGVDSVSTKMLLELSDEIADIVAVLFNKSLISGDVPHEWKLANVTPVFKKGSKSSSSNYRPVSLTVNLCKVFESIMRDKIIEHIEKHKLVRESQHGFVKGRSCLTNLLVFLEEVSSYLDSGYPVDVIYLDFQKAFDKVPHRRLALKLSAHGIDGHVLHWIENWLTDRKQRVALSGQVSEWRNVLSGVPQGSVLGPLLFVLFINDIDDSVTSKILKFADDTKIFNTVRSEEMIENLRTDLSGLMAWSKEWQMLFNVNKCKVMHLGYNNPSVDYYMDTVQLQVVKEEKDLGVVITDDLKWDNQCAAAVKQANRVLGMIKRSFTDRSKETIMALYKSLVRPHLEYCVPVWSPHLIKDIKLVEGVQRRATKLVQGIGAWKYDERLRYLGLSRLAKRRVRSDLIETFKIIHGMYDINREYFFDFDVGDRRGHDQKLYKKRFKLDLRKYAFSNRVVNNWNMQSAHCVNACTIDTFKKYVSVD